MNEATNAKPAVGPGGQWKAPDANTDGLGIDSTTQSEVGRPDDHANGTDLARQTIRDLLSGESPNGRDPGDFGTWAEHVRELYAAYAARGTKGVRKAFKALASDDKVLMTLVCGDGDPSPEWGLRGDSPRLELEIPPLPESARLADHLGKDASPWLDKYIAFSRKWSPRAYEGFHTACGLWLLSTVAARRVLLHFGKPRFTPLTLALVARTSLYVKSTTAEIAIATLKAAGLDWLLAADDATPQKFIQDLTGPVPDDYDSLPKNVQDRIKKRCAFAGQRGWFYEEFGQKVHAMNNRTGYMTEFRGILRRFDDCWDTYEYGTISRGTDFVKQPYLALLANMTPADLRPFAKKGHSMWGDGFWARFVFVTPHTHKRKRGRFPRGERLVPSALVRPLQEWHRRLGMPSVSIVEKENASGDAIGKKAEASGIEPQLCTWEDGVRDALYDYDNALLDIIERSDSEDMDGNYSRFAEKALRVAMLLASLENGGHIELRHWARAQGIAEQWRADLHALYEQVNEPPLSKAEQEEERVLLTMQKHGEMTAAQISRYHRGMDTGRAGQICEILARAGVLEPRKTKRTTYYDFPKSGTVDE
jgi:hypothetical protein